MKKKMVFFAMLLSATSVCQAQLPDPTRFADQVAELAKAAKNVDTENLILFTGSSSVRMWKDLDERYPDKNILNHGFGGSVMNDLNYFLEPLVLNYMPSQVFIYEGDNDMSSQIPAEDVLVTAKEIVAAIHAKFPKTEIVFISPKPSIARWDLQSSYLQMNNLLKTYAEKHALIKYADVWSAMLDSNGVVFQDIFLEDDLHMNEKGYDLWAEVIGPMLK